MSESWIEKYNRRKSKSGKETDLKDDFDVFYQLSGVDHLQVDTDKAWNKFLDHLPAQKNQGSFSRVWKIAASIILILSASVVIYQLQTPSDTTINYTTAYSESTKKAVSLPDGSIVTLARNSSIQYPEGSFADDRRVKFTGEGFFEVTKNKKSFSVETTGAIIEVLGTSFGLDTRKDTRVIVDDGVVSLKTSKEERKIRKGEAAQANRENGNITLVETDPNALSWKTGKFQFSDTKLAEAFGYLNQYYDVTFTSTKALEHCKITVQFDEEPLSNVVEVLTTILNAKSTISDKEVKFSGKGCN